MIDFRVLKESPKSRARLGFLKTPHGEIETPALVGVATQATVKTLTSEEANEAKLKLLICNTYHLHLRPGEKIVKANGGLHEFMNWNSGLMTDSGGFQVFSLGFGRDFGLSKVSKSASKETLEEGSQPRNLKITGDGVFFKSHLDGREIFLGPKESIKIQEDLGADIILAFDECPPPIAGREYVLKSLERTHRWAKECLRAKKSQQALYGIVQGGRFKDLRSESARFIDSLGFDGYAIGGEFGSDKSSMMKMLETVNAELDASRPRHLLGIGYLEDIPKIVKSGVDTFDCTAPTHYGRRGIAFVSSGKLDLNKAAFLKDRKPLDRTCGCPVCGAYSRSYISHLIRAKEISGLKLLTVHNLFFFNTYIEKIRQDIKKGRL
ncbi:MAG TPA: tRNA guanosine(34) transglycosylase Tgt [Candidatus Colwellbacteria bacterium]|nr:tRNA guanosine(34) transglycosylase Tgt [Candidatus Colwellbacteria bacterium]